MAVNAVSSAVATSIGNRMGDGAYKLIQLVAVTATDTQYFAAPCDGRIVGVTIVGVDAHTSSNYVTVTVVNGSNSDAAMVSGITTSGAVAAKTPSVIANGVVTAAAVCNMGDLLAITSTESGTLAGATCINVMFEAS